jgi:hypothetical protein
MFHLLLNTVEVMKSLRKKLHALVQVKLTNKIRTLGNIILTANLILILLFLNLFQMHTVKDMRNKRSNLLKKNPVLVMDRRK